MGCGCSRGAQVARAERRADAASARRYRAGLHTMQLPDVEKDVMSPEELARLQLLLAPKDACPPPEPPPPPPPESTRPPSEVFEEEPPTPPGSGGPPHFPDCFPDSASDVDEWEAASAVVHHGAGSSAASRGAVGWGKVTKERDRDCVASFPGRYAGGWGAVGAAGGQKHSVACVFLRGPGDGEYGEHVHDPDSGAGGCYCAALYGRRGRRACGYLTPAERTLAGLDDEAGAGDAAAEEGESTPKVTSPGWNSELKREIGKVKSRWHEQEGESSSEAGSRPPTGGGGRRGRVKSPAPAPVEQLRTKNGAAELERAEEEWEKNGRRPRWGCKWFHRWRRNVDKAAKHDQQLVVYCLRGQVGEGKVAWDRLSDPAEDLWDGVGLGGSQKAEVAWLDKAGLPYRAADAADFIAEHTRAPHCAACAAASRGEPPPPRRPRKDEPAWPTPLTEPLPCVPLQDRPPGGDTADDVATIAPRGEMRYQRFDGARLRGQDLRGRSLEGASMTGADLRYCKLTGCDVRRCDMKGADLRGSDWSGAQTTGTGLRKTLLTDAAHRAPPTGLVLTANDFSGVQLNDACLRGAQLQGVRFQEGSLQRAELLRADLTSAVLLMAAMEGADLRGADFTSAQMFGARLAGCLLTDADFPHPPVGLEVAGRDIEGLRMTYAWMRGYDLSGVQMGKGRTRLPRCDLSYAMLQEADLSATELRDSSLRGADLSGSRAINAQLQNTDFAGADLSGAGFSGADMTGADMRGSILLDTALPALRRTWITDAQHRDLPTGLMLTGRDLSHARLDYAALRGHSLREARLVKASLTLARLPSADLTQADLTQANLRGAYMRRARLPRSVLQGADLTRANLARTDLSGADLSGAQFEGATLDAADLRGSDMTGAQVDYAILTRVELTSPAVPEPPQGLDLGAHDRAGRRWAHDLARCGLYHADLRGRQMPGARMPGARMRHARLDSANAAGADLSHTDLTDADCAGADLSGVDLSSATMCDGTWAGADLRGARMLTPIEVDLPVELTEGSVADLGVTLAQAVATANVEGTEVSRSESQSAARTAASRSESMAAMTEASKSVPVRWEVQGVAPGSAADRAGVRAGMLLSRVRGVHTAASPDIPALLVALAAEAAAPGGASTLHPGDAAWGDPGAADPGQVPVGAVFVDPGAAADVTGALFGGARLTDARRPLPAPGLDLVASDFADCRMEHASLRGAALPGARLERVTFSHADLRGAVLRGAALEGADFSGANLCGADLSRADLRNCVFDAATRMEGCSLIGANCGGTRFDNPCLRGAVLTSASHPQFPKGLVMRARDAAGASLRHAKLRGHDLEGASLRGAALHGATLHDAHLVDADLSGCDLSKTNLTGADLRGCNLLDTSPLLPFRAVEVGMVVMMTPEGFRPGRDFFAGVVVRKHRDHGGEPRATVRWNELKDGGPPPRYDYPELDPPLLPRQRDEREGWWDGAGGARVPLPPLRGAQLTDAAHPDPPPGIIVRGLDLRGACLERARLCGMDCSGVKIRKGELMGADLRGSRFDAGDLFGCDLRQAQVSGASFDGCDLRGTDMTGCDVTGSPLRGALLANAERPDPPLGMQLRRTERWAMLEMEAKWFQKENLGMVFRSPSELVLAAVAEGSPADRSGLHDFIGWRLFRVDSTPVLDGGDVRALLDALKRGGGEVQVDFYLAADLTGAVMEYIDLEKGFGDDGYNAASAVMRGCRLRHANLTRVDLSTADLRGADMLGATLVDADLRGADFTGAALPGPECRGALLTDMRHRALPVGLVLRGRDLQGAAMDYCAGQGVDFHSADLTSAKFLKADLSGACLDYAKMCNADLSMSTLLSATMAYADLRKANVTQAMLCIADLPRYERPENWDTLPDDELHGVVLRQTILTNKHSPVPPVGLTFARRDLTEATLQYARLRGVSLTRCVLRKACLMKSELNNCDLRNADLTAADVRGASMRRCNLEGAVLRAIELTDGQYPVPPITLAGRDLNECSLRGADLRGADMTRASLQRARMYRADFTRADLSGADLSYAYFSDARGCEDAQWDGTILVGANLPERFEERMKRERGERGCTLRW